MARRTNDLTRMRTRFLLALGVVPSACASSRPAPTTVSPTPEPGELGSSMAATTPVTDVDSSAEVPVTNADPPRDLITVATADATAPVPGSANAASTTRGRWSTVVRGRHICVPAADTADWDPASHPTRPAPPFEQCRDHANLERISSNVAMPCGPCSFTFDPVESERERRRVRHADACCYQTSSPPLGRALRTEAGVVTSAAPIARLDWSVTDARTSVARIGLSPRVRSALASAWAAAGAMEHASVAAFARVSLDLIALGAPPELLMDTHDAALDEIAHAQLCYGLAFAYAGESVGPGPLRGAMQSARTPSATQLARETMIDGCIGETLAALEASAAARAARDPVVRAVLERIAIDESRHAELAWRTLAWLLTVDGDGVRSAARHTLDARAVAPGVTQTRGLGRHGWLGETERRALRRRAIEQVVRPCLDAALSGRSRVAA